jgi:hypothetical protein
MQFAQALPQDLVEAGLVGPRLTALIGWFKGVCHMSISGIHKFFRDVLGARVSKGLIAKVVDKVSASLKDPYEELLNLLASEERLNVDETGHKDNGRRWWTWCFRALTYTVFKISPSRGSDVLMELVGQGKRTLIPCQANNLREVVAIPPCHATPHGDTLVVVLLLEEADGEAFQPGKVVCGVAIAESTIILLSPVVKVSGTGI